ncbi:outer membrane beta-barrel protein [Paraferrimonas sp. SM1919]|uniref:outer membrane beta-barrel protein n=1 Tax=Paraferrimonas sp. SM1919 TaxID=2662263 RepID=UPI0013D45B0E|nr:outer membrane beta-barrel protein [Paraferrimonas sp. SM1919]
MRLIALLLASGLTFTAIAAEQPSSKAKDPRTQNKVGLGGITLMDGRINFGPSFGIYPGKDKYFWGFSGGYTHMLDDKWSVSGVLAWDQEVEPQDNGPNKQSHTFTAIATVNYAINDTFTITTGIAKGFLEDSNPRKEYEFVDGDWSTGVSLGISTPINDHLSFDFSTSYEYNLTQNEYDISFDGGFSVPF